MIKKLYKANEWQIIEETFNPENQEMSESMFSIGNGYMGQRANFEESYSGQSLQGTYIAGIYYPDKTRVGWWKNGYPEYFAKVLNAPNWIGIDIDIAGEKLDIAKSTVHSFRRVLDMKQGTLHRDFSVTLQNKKKLSVSALRFVSIKREEAGVIQYTITAESDFTIRLSPYIDADVKNKDSNYNEKFWNQIAVEVDNGKSMVVSETKKTAFRVATGMTYSIKKNNILVAYNPEISKKEGFVSNTVSVEVKKGDTVTIHKYASVVTSCNYSNDALVQKCGNNLTELKAAGFETLLQEHVAVWEHKWSESDIVIEGDVEAQQGIRFNIFQLNQTYTGIDARLNIGPKGFTGEKYGGSTYWDTEAFCLSFYLSTASQDVAKNLLLYRYKQLDKAIENGKKLGFEKGAALFPMVTMNGEECHNEWEITFEEIHRNGAIAFAVNEYVSFTGDKQYLIDNGLELLIAISRFWKQRITFSKAKNKYVMLGVTGPNEYENNVNNNWYTNLLATWTMQYTIESYAFVKEKNAHKLSVLSAKIAFDESELKDWTAIIANMYFPFDSELGIILQQEGYMDKEQILAADIPVSQRPINQHWSWDRILRSCFIKQADVVQGLYSLEEKFDTETIRKNFTFYEARTVHESSLSASIHSVVASKIKDLDKAYELYVRTARHDLDDYNHEANEGLHITSMAGSWLAIVKGFAGMRVKADLLYFDPIIPKQWESFTFRIKFRQFVLQVKVSNIQIEFQNVSNRDITVKVRDEFVSIQANQSVIVAV